jgi:hypothetical protein
MLVWVIFKNGQRARPPNLKNKRHIVDLRFIRADCVRGYLIETRRFGSLFIPKDFSDDEPRDGQVVRVGRRLFFRKLKLKPAPGPEVPR